MFILEFVFIIEVGFDDVFLGGGLNFEVRVGIDFLVIDEEFLGIVRIL